MYGYLILYESTKPSVQSNASKNESINYLGLRVLINHANLVGQLCSSDEIHLIVAQQRGISVFALIQLLSSI